MSGEYIFWKQRLGLQHFSCNNESADDGADDVLAIIHKLPIGRRDQLLYGVRFMRYGETQLVLIGFPLLRL